MGDPPISHTRGRDLAGSLSPQYKSGHVCMIVIPLRSVILYECMLFSALLAEVEEIEVRYVYSPPTELDVRHGQPTAPIPSAPPLP